MLRDRIVLGVANNDLQAKLLRIDDLTLDKAKEISRIAELTNVQAKEIQQGAKLATPRGIDKITSKPGPSKFNAYQENSYHSKFANNGSKMQPNQFQRYSNTPNSYYHSKNSQIGTASANRTTFNCNNCSYKHLYGQCPAFGKRCKKCNKFNHFADVCRSVMQIQAKMDDLANEDNNGHSLDTFFVDSVSAVNCKVDVIKDLHDKSWYENLKIGNMIIKFKLDSGADVNILPESLYEAILPKPIIRSSSLSLEAFGGFKLTLIGEITVNIQ